MEEEVKELRKLKKEIDVIFNQDQIQFILNKKVLKWSEATIQNGIYLKHHCGQGGYEQLISMGFPWPSVRTLNRRVEHIIVKPGIQDEIFQIMEKKVQQMDPEDRQCIVNHDECAILPRVMYNITCQAMCGYATIKSSSEVPDGTLEVASHGFIFLLCGVRTRWKQTVCIEFTANAFDAGAVADILRNIFRRCKQIGLNCLGVVSDMGPGNMGI